MSGKLNVKSAVNIALRLFIVCTVIASVVASVNLITADRIAENEKKVINDTIRSIFDYDVLNIESVGYKNDDDCVKEIYRIRKDDGTLIGYSAICSPKGFGGEIRLMTAFDDGKNIIAVRVMGHSETPGIGDKIENVRTPAFTEQFVGKNEIMQYGKDGIDKISGSSKSSNAVLKGINEAILALGTVK